MPVILELQNPYAVNSLSLSMFVEALYQETTTGARMLQILFDDPMIMNKEIAEQVFLSVEGIGSALRRMYELFNIQGTKYKKMALLREVIKLSNG